MKRLAALLAALAFAFTGAALAKEEPKKADAAKAAPAKAAKQIDINSASAKELMTLKGIGEARAADIIKGRPYTGKDQLVDKKIIPESVYADIKEQIIAHQAAAKKTDAKKEAAKK